jgi:hypothetical protein
MSYFRLNKAPAPNRRPRFPDAPFYEIMKTEITRCETRTDKLIVIAFANGIEMHLVDDSDQYECMQIHFKGKPAPWII